MKNMITDLLKNDNYSSFEFAMFNGSYAIHLYVGERLSSTIANLKYEHMMPIAKELMAQGIAPAK